LRQKIIGLYCQERQLFSFAIIFVYNTELIFCPFVKGDNNLSEKLKLLQADNAASKYRNKLEPIYLLND
jgi:hypothetical protein